MYVCVLSLILCTTCILFVVHSPGYVNEATNSILTLNLSLAHDLAEYPHQVIRNENN